MHLGNRISLCLWQVTIGELGLIAFRLYATMGASQFINLSLQLQIADLQILGALYVQMGALRIWWVDPEEKPTTKFCLQPHIQ